MREAPCMLSAAAVWLLAPDVRTVRPHRTWLQTYYNNVWKDNRQLVRDDNVGQDLPEHLRTRVGGAAHPS